MLNTYARAFFTRVLTPFAAFLLRRGVTPDMVTLVGTLGVVVGALAFYPRGSFFWGTIVITVFIFADLIDGNMARQSGRTSRWGAFLDSTLDRIADAALFGGLAMWYAGKGHSLLLVGVAVFCLGSGQVVSYTKARAESLGLQCKVSGLVERAERLLITLVLFGVSGLHEFGVPYVEWLRSIALWIVAVGSLITLFQRMNAIHTDAVAQERAAAEQQQAEEPASEGPVSERQSHG